MDRFILDASLKSVNNEFNDINTLATTAQVVAFYFQDKSSNFYPSNNS